MTLTVDWVCNIKYLSVYPVVAEVVVFIVIFSDILGVQVYMWPTLTRGNKVAGKITR